LTALGLALGATASVAAGNPNAPVRGVVIGVSAESMEIQSASGPVTVAFTGQTRVIRTVSGTVADLRKGQIVQLALGARSGRVVQIHIALPGTPPGQIGGSAQILAASSKRIRVRSVRGRVVSYRLASKPRVIKDVRGNIGDLAIGQTVLVTRTHAGRVAKVITILRG